MMLGDEMFENFSKKIQNNLDGIIRQRNLNEEDIKNAIKEIRLTLLEADVNYKVAKEFCKKIEQKAASEEILRGLNPSDQVVKIVKDEMELLLASDSELNFKNNNIIMMVGLQGSGKTTSTGKIASYLRKKKKFKNPLLIACDVYRPAAVEQLKTLGKQLSIDVYSEEHQDVQLIAQNGIAFAKENNYDLIILDTAGRTHVDEKLMDEIKLLEETFNPAETLLVVDGSVGQISVDVANSFQKYVQISGVVFTKMDGDSRGGGVLSVKSATGIDIKFLGTSEKMDGIELFNTERVVGRILGNGDVLGLIEKAEEMAEGQDTEEMAQKMLEGKFDLNDFLSQMKMLKKMGGLSSILGMIPGAKKMDLSKVNDGDIQRFQAIIESMTLEERTTPALLNSSRRKRIAVGSGTSVQDVNKLIKGYENSKKMMKQMKGMDPSKMMNMFK